MARPFFSKDRTADLERFDKHIQKAISLFAQRMKAGHAIDFQVCYSKLLPQPSILTRIP